MPESDLWKSLDWLVEGSNASTRGSSRLQGARAALARLVGNASNRRTGFYVLGLSLLFAFVAWLALQDPGTPAAQTRVAPPAAPRIDAPFAPGAMRDLSRADAMALNAAVLDNARTDAASAFVLDSPQAVDYQRSVDCLAQAIHYEAASEGEEGGRAVAQVVLNRVRHSAYPDTVCGVVYEGAERATGCQFTFACDGSLARTPSARAWQRARAIAIAALAGEVYRPVGWSTHYHANYVVPYWAASLQKTANVGAHVFYRWTGTWGEAGAFNRRYAGNEPLAPLLLGAEEETPEAKLVAEPGLAQVPALLEARPILLAEPRPAADPSSESSAPTRDVALGDRQILIHPRSLASPPDPSPPAHQP